VAKSPLDGTFEGETIPGCRVREGAGGRAGTRDAAWPRPVALPPGVTAASRISSWRFRPSAANPPPAHASYTVHTAETRSRQPHGHRQLKVSKSSHATATLTSFGKVPDVEHGGVQVVGAENLCHLGGCPTERRRSWGGMIFGLRLEADLPGCVPRHVAVHGLGNPHQRRDRPVSCRDRPARAGFLRSQAQGSWPWSTRPGAGSCSRPGTCSWTWRTPGRG
jgi:hypothetical protein